MKAQITSIEHYEQDFFVVKAVTRLEVPYGSSTMYEWVKSKVVVTRDQIKHLFPGDTIEVSVTLTEADE